VSWNGVATAFPSNIAWGAAFDTGLIRDIGRTISLEMRAKWVAGLSSKGGSAEFAGLSFMTPNNNLFVNPAWGRGQETFGESPFLTSAITYELIKALQFEEGNSEYTRAIATTKHFCACWGAPSAAAHLPRSTPPTPHHYHPTTTTTTNNNPHPPVGYHLESWDGDGQYRLSHSYN
jgi:beta-glucosidase